MASNLQKHFQRKIADIDNEEDEELQTQCQNNPTFGFTEGFLTKKSLSLL